MARSGSKQVHYSVTGKQTLCGLNLLKNLMLTVAWKDEERVTCTKCLDKLTEPEPKAA